MNIIYALTGTAFFLTFLSTLIIYGDDTSRNIAILAAFIAGISQFIAQDGRRSVGIASIVLAYTSMLMGLVSFCIMAF